MSDDPDFWRRVQEHAMAMDIPDADRYDFLIVDEGQDFQQEWFEILNLFGDLADAVFKARSSKRVIAFASDLVASAAYWVGSQADQMFANPTALIGSIGTYALIADFWRLFHERPS